MRHLNMGDIMAGALLSACLIQTSMAAVLTQGKSTKLMPVGDSITLGKDTVTGGYRSVLYEWLTASGYAITYVGKGDDGDPANATVTSSKMTTPSSHEGYGSFRTDMILNGGSAEKRTAPPLKETLAKYRPDIVLLMIGTNDIIQDKDLEHLNERMEKLIATVLESDSNITLLVASIAPIRHPKWAGKESQVMAFNAAVQAMVARHKALHHKIDFVDVHASLEKEGLSGDGVHPNQGGYRKIAGAWYQALTGETAPLAAAPAVMKARN